MNHAMRWAALIVLGGVAAGCGTREYQQERRTCLQEWMIHIPPAYQQVFVNRQRAVQVPDGTSSCTKTGNTTSCSKGMRTEWIPYTAVETVDVNADERNVHVAQCAATLCVQFYGNPDCKTG